MESSNRLISALKRRRAVALCTTAMALAASVTVALAGGGDSPTPAEKAYKVLYRFRGGDDGFDPVTGLIADKAGNLYGTTGLGGGTGCGGNGCGTVFSLAPGGTERVLHAFSGSDGSNAAAAMIFDEAGNLYGTTEDGGANNLGTVFKLAPDGTLTTLHSFAADGIDGSYPLAGVVEYMGAFYGATQAGGTGYGTVYKIAADGTETVLYSFQPRPDGEGPCGTPIMDSAGNLYGTTFQGGLGDGGAIYEIAADGKETTLYQFKGGTDGLTPFAPLIRDKAGNLYGTTRLGGASGRGTIFKLSPGDTETVLYSFKGHKDGQFPLGGLLQGGGGNLYGTTPNSGAHDFGTVFKLAPDGTLTVLHAFRDGRDGAQPVFVSMIKDSANAKVYLYGTTGLGGPNEYGTVFKVRR